MNVRLRNWLTRRRIIGLSFSLIVLCALKLAWPYGELRWQVERAKRELSRGEIAAAEQRLEIAQKRHPASREVALLHAQALRRAGRFEEFARCLELAAASGAPQEALLQQQNLALLQTGDSRQAQAYLDRVLQSGADDDLAEQIYEAQAQGLLSTYRLNEALMCLEYWLKWRPGTRRALLWRADIWERSEGFADAIADYRRVIEIAPDDVETRLKLGKLLQLQNDPQSALKEYERCLALEPGLPLALLGAARCRRTIGDEPPHDDELEGLLSHELPASVRAEILEELGEGDVFQQRYQSAIERLEEARRLDPQNRQVWYPLAAAYRQMGNHVLASELAREGEATRTRYNRISELTAQMITRPDDADLRYEAGKTLIEQGLAREGAAWLATALACNPGHRASHQALAEYFESQGDLDRARQHRAAAEASP